MNESTPIKEILADPSHPAHEATKAMLADLESGKISMCACLGPMYGEPHCVCRMTALGLPLNEAAREVERKRSEKQSDSLFAPGGVFYKKPKGSV